MRRFQDDDVDDSVLDRWALLARPEPPESVEERVVDQAAPGCQMALGG